jgi:hypothetical protein
MRRQGWMHPGHINSGFGEVATGTAPPRAGPYCHRCGRTPYLDNYV